MWIMVCWVLGIAVVIGLITTRADGLGMLNFVVLQWTLFRYVRVVDNETGRFMRWGWMGPVAPMTGWWTEYVPKEPSILRTKAERLAEQDKESHIVQRKRKLKIPR